MSRGARIFGRVSLVLASFSVFLFVFFILHLIDAAWYFSLLLIIPASFLIWIQMARSLATYKRVLCRIAILIVTLFLLPIARPDHSISFSITLARELVRFAFSSPALRDGGVFALGNEYSKRPSLWQAPAGYTLEKIALPNASLELFHSNEERDASRVVYQLHGGGYLIGLVDMYRNQALNYARKLKVDVVSLDYRTAPDYLFPAALDDALDGYRYLLNSGYAPEGIVVVGDSAGGNLALALTLALLQEGLPVPSGLVLMSPWADLAATGSSRITNIYKDPMFGIPEGAPLPQSSLPPVYAGTEDLMNPLLSPAHASLEGFPPLLIQVGTWEILESDSLMIHKNALEAGVPSTLQRFEGMFHVFQLVGGPSKESKAALEDVYIFMRKQLGVLSDVE
jgi:epsilon-lactone hydrolase